MYLKSVVFSVLVILVNPSYGQTGSQLNQTDPKGLKQGHWIKKNSSGHVIYDGYFKDNEPIGVMKRYFDNDSLQTIMNYRPDHKTVDVEIYHPNGFPASKGTYVNKLKEGKWQFYSEYEKGYLICEESYTQNKKNGLSVKYYKDSTPAEKINYTDDTRNGSWIQYFENGQVCLSGNYVNGILDGNFTCYYEDGKPDVKGQYKENVRDGEWIKYNPDGTVRKRMIYRSGELTNADAYKEETDFLDKMEKNKGLIPDPEKTGTLWNNLPV